LHNLSNAGGLDKNKPKNIRCEKMKAYLDNGATTRTDPLVVEAMLPYFGEKYGNASSLHSFGREAKQALEEARATIAKKINGLPEEIIFTSGGTESDNLAIKGIAFAHKDKGNHIITSKIEHPAVLSTCASLEKDGFKVTYIDVDKEGFVKLENLEKAITPKTILITIMHANNEIGTVQPIDKIGEICKKHKIFFHTDAVQSFTKVPIDVKKINVDLISISGHKIHGPKGVGALFVKKGTKLKKLNEGGSHELKLRAGTENVSGIVGFSKAATLTDEKTLAHMAKLRDKMINELLKIPHTQLNGPREMRLCNNVNISFHYIEGESMLMTLDDKGIAVSTGSACSSQSLEPSHVLLAIGLTPVVAHGSIRFTLSKFTTEEEIDYTISAVKEAVNRFREFSPLTR
jgi:cysteine desulfurase